jgi:capsid portal protein
MSETETASTPVRGITAFAIDDAVSVLERRDLLLHVESWSNGRWYEPPIAPRTLAQLLQASPHHGSAIRTKRNLLVKHFVPHPQLSRDEFGKFVLDFLVMDGGLAQQPVAQHPGRAEAGAILVRQQPLRGA